jgi:hypothetical protein
MGESSTKVAVFQQPASGAEWSSVNVWHTASLIQRIAFAVLPEVLGDIVPAYADHTAERGSIARSFPMAAASHSTSPSASTAGTFSLVIGGPFYRTLVRMRLVEDPGPNIARRIVALLTVTWAPLVLLALMQGVAFGGKVNIPLFYDFSIYGRFLVGLPLLIVAEIVIDPWIRRVVATFDATGIIGEADLPVFHAALARIARLRDSSIAELIIAGFAFCPFFLLEGYDWGSTGAFAWHTSPSGRLSVAGWWFALVAAPVLRFLIFRWFWRYALWTALLRSIARLRLDLVPTHPDRLGGLGFVVFAQKHFGILFGAAGSLVAGYYANAIAYFGTPLAAVKASMAAFVIFALVVVLAPLTMFSPKLAETRRNGWLRYSRVGRHLAGSFESKWIDEPSLHEGDLLEARDSSSLANYGKSFDVIQEMRIVPINKQLVIQVAAEAAAPLAALWIFATPMDQLIAKLLKMLL